MHVGSWQCISIMLINLWIYLPGRLRSTIDSYEPVFGLCKNTTKIFGSLDNGYHTNFSHIYKTSQTPQLETEQNEDEVDWWLFAQSALMIIVYD